MSEEKIEVDIYEINKQLENLCEILNKYYEDYDIELQEYDLRLISDINKRKKYYIKVITHYELGWKVGSNDE